MIICVASNSLTDLKPLLKSVAKQLSLKYYDNLKEKGEGFFSKPDDGCLYFGYEAVFKINNAKARIFLKYSDVARLKQFIKESGLPAEEAKKVLKEKDSLLYKKYINNYGINIKDYSIYDLVLNAEYLDSEGIFAVIEKYLNKMKG